MNDAVHATVGRGGPNSGPRPTARVVFGVRGDLESAPGGDTVQILNTAAALRARGVTVDVRGPGALDARAGDVVHLWHLERVHESFAHFVAARRAGAAVALSTIYWPRDGEPRRVSRGWIEDAKNVWRWCKAAPPARDAIARALAAGWSACRRELLLGADVLLPNSRAEGAVLESEARDAAARVGAGGHVRWREVCNAVDADACRAAIARAAGRRRTGIVSVGHFDPRKNQLQLIRALEGSGASVTFIGGPRPMHAPYHARCVRAAGGRHRFLGPRRTAETLDELAAAAVHVCPSLLETPGLANLEASAVGCAVVVPDCAPVREYFEDQAEYFTPGDERSLAGAVRRALDHGPRAGLAERVTREFNWDRAAEQTLDAYAAALAARAAEA